MATFYTVCVIFVCVLAKSLSQTAPQCKMFGIHEIIPKDDCTGWYLCLWGQPVEMPNCHKGDVFSRSAHVCVPINSIYNDCPLHVRVIRTTQNPLTIDEQCSQNKSAIIPHPTECQLYYNCSVNYTYVPRYFEQHLVECPYPKLFSTDSFKCEEFDNVSCGNRKETKSGCGYRYLQCPVAHCIPCSIRVPSCELTPDGINPHPEKKWSPYYIVCRKERFISEERCPADEKGRTQLFSPETNMCTSLDFIPQKHGGLMNNCTGKEDGANADDFGRCDLYAECQNGDFVNIVKCPSGLVFDTAERKCMFGKDACAPCGGKQGCRSQK
ncbi:hypothetical protein CHS0354_027815 [Potamilus streckersoni]|uniref:Chitin-binding type-2 domain-containing protein n=1 Tax=Potamilus streckersoni TaxID=2493646 RepID=A0AAE0T0W5_9BIVA|nr:hypothetical protein CHS0354_027815 [Potamilus streckersoni]